MHIHYKHVRFRERSYDTDSDHHRPRIHRTSSKRHPINVDPPYYSDRNNSPSAYSTASSYSRNSRRYEDYYHPRHTHIRSTSPARPLKSALKKPTRRASTAGSWEDYNVFNDSNKKGISRSYSCRGFRDLVVDDDWDSVEEWDGDWKYNTKASTTRTRTPSPAYPRYTYANPSPSPRSRSSSFSYERSRVRSTSPLPRAVRLPARSYPWDRFGSDGDYRSWVEDEPKVWPCEAFRRKSDRWDDGRQREDEVRYVTVVPRREVEREREREMERERRRESEVRYSGGWRPLRLRRW